MEINKFSTSGKLHNNLDEILVFSHQDSYLFIVADPFNDHNYDEYIHSTFMLGIKDLIHQEISFDKVIEYLDAYTGRVRYSIAVIYINNHIMQTAYTGDCRVYFNKNLITTDFSKAWQTISPAANNIKGGLCINHIYQRYIYEYLPVANCTVLDNIPLKPNDKIYVTTDGFWAAHHYEIILSGDINIHDKEYIDNASYISIVL